MRIVDDAYCLELFTRLGAAITAMPTPTTLQAIQLCADIYADMQTLNTFLAARALGYEIRSVSRFVLTDQAGRPWHPPKDVLAALQDLGL